MSESAGKHAYGSYLEYSTDGNTWNNGHIEVQMVNQPAIKRAAVRATHLESPGAMKETRAGIGEVTPFKATCTYTATIYNTLKGFVDNRTYLYWRISHPLESGQSTPDRDVIYGWVSEIGEVKLDPEDTNIEVFDLEITNRSGTPAFTPGS